MPDVARRTRLDAKFPTVIETLWLQYEKEPYLSDHCRGSSKQR
jgi:hypothetical protein